MVDVLTELCLVGLTLAVWGSLVLLVWGVAPFQAPLPEGFVYAPGALGRLGISFRP